MKYLISGGAGFIGSHLVARLAKSKKNEIVVVDNYSTGHEKNHVKSNQVRYIHADVCDYRDMEKYDRVINLACPASPVSYQLDPIQTMLTNVQGTYNMLALAHLSNARFLQASTSEIYGDPIQHPQTEEYWGNVNCYGIRACFSDDTEILTNSGWKLFKDLDSSDKVATLNNNSLEYNYPDEFMKYEYSGNMYKFTNFNIDLAVTPNHKMLFRNRNMKLELKEAEKMSDFSHLGIIKECEWKGKEEEFFYFPEYTKSIKNSKKQIINRVKMDDWLEFMGYYLTEGCTYLSERDRYIGGKRYKCLEYKIQISQSEEKHPIVFDKIKKCLIRLGIDFSISKYNNSYFVFSNKQIYTYLVNFGKSKDKFVSREFLELSKRQLQILYTAMIDGDGTRRKGEYNSPVYYTISKRLVDDMQEILLKLGYYGNIKFNEERNIYSVTCIERSVNHHKYPKPNIEKYSGNVYCVNVKNHVICVRRNGILAFCGNCYDEGKRAAETLVHDFQRVGAIDGRIIRIFNTYGPNMAVHDGRVVSNFIVQALRGDPITIYGDGSQTRSFCYVSDTVEAILKVLEGTYSKPLNVGNPGEFTMLELATEVIKLTKTKSQIITKPLPEDDPKSRQPDITKMKDLFNWEPKIQVEDGLQRTIEYFRGLDEFQKIGK